MPTVRANIEEPLRTNLQEILGRENLDNQRAIIKALTTELGADFLDFAAAMLYLYQHQTQPSITSHPIDQGRPGPSQRSLKQPGIRMVRYRLEVGHKHRMSQEELIKVLVEESGVDKKNIINVDIQDVHTFIELPDEMPHDIFQHLKLVEINQQKLDIKRVKNRSHKKRSNHRSRSLRQRQSKSSVEASDKAYNS